MTLYADCHVVCRDLGFRLISASRAGYGESSRMPHRSVSDATADSTAILDRFGQTPFVTMGWSGGDPHALARAALLRPWGFELEEIRVPVTVWQGELDLMVRLARGRWLAEKIPATPRIESGQGHISLSNSIGARNESAKRIRSSS